MKKTNYERVYMCVGANYKNGYDLKYVGDVYSLRKWLDLLFPGRDAISYFNGDSNEKIIKYIFDVCGKRLEKYK